MINRGKKRRLMANKSSTKGYDPIKHDPTQTAFLRQTMEKKLKSKFAQLKGAIHTFLITQDKLGLARNALEVTETRDLRVVNQLTKLDVKLDLTTERLENKIKELENQTLNASYFAECERDTKGHCLPRGSFHTADALYELGKTVDDAGLKVLDVASKGEHAVMHFARAVIEKLWGAGESKIPKAVRHSVNFAMEAAFATWSMSQAFAERVAKERGMSTAQAARLKVGLAAADMVAYKPMVVLAPAAIGALATFVPPATAAYLLQSTARNPIATLKAAIGLVRDGTVKLWKSIPKSEGTPVAPAPYIRNTSVEDAKILAEAMETHNFDDWYMAILHAAMGETKDLGKAIHLADTLFKKYQSGPQVPSEYTPGEDGWLFQEEYPGGPAYWTDPESGQQYNARIIHNEETGGAGVYSRGDNAVLHSQQTSSIEIGIIGGGPGGLITAYLLRQRVPNCKVTIYEASDRLGGKIKTQTFQQEPGANFEGGVAELYAAPKGKPDPLRDLIDELGLERFPIQGESVVMGDKLIIDEDHVGDVFGKSAQRGVKEFYKKSWDAITPEQYHDRKYTVPNDHPMVHKTYADILEGIDEDARKFIEAYTHSDVAVSPTRTTAMYGIQNLLTNDPDYLTLYTLRGGIEELPRALAKRLMKDSNIEIHLNTKVTACSAGRSGYTITYQDKNEEKESRGFDKVICCLPAGWVQSVDWGQDLNLKVREYLKPYDNLGNYLRVTLLFNRPFWKSGSLAENSSDFFKECQRDSKGHCEPSSSLVTKEAANKYVAYFDHDGQSFKVNFARPIGGKTWEVAFGLGNQQSISIDMSQTRKAGVGAVSIFRKVGRILDHFISKESPKEFEFSAEKILPKRVKLYNTLAKELEKRYSSHYSLKTSDTNVERRYTFSREATANNEVMLTANNSDYFSKCDRDEKGYCLPEETSKKLPTYVPKKKDHPPSTPKESIFKNLFDLPALQSHTPHLGPRFKFSGNDLAKTHSNDGINRIDVSKVPGWNTSDGEPRSYGAVLMNKRGDKILLREPTGKYDHYAWTFAKGTPDKGKDDHPAVTATREMEEETGYKGKILSAIPGKFRGGTSSVNMFLMQAGSRDVNKMDSETSRVRWATYHEARTLISQTENEKGYARDMAILNAAFRHAKKIGYTANELIINEEEEKESSTYGNIVGHWWMTDAFNGACVYAESERLPGCHVGILGWLIAGDAAQLMGNYDKERLAQECLNSLPTWLQDAARATYLDVRVNRYIGEVSGLPGAAGPIYGTQIWCDKENHPNLMFIGDYQYDGTLNGVWESADDAVKWIQAAQNTEQVDNSLRMRPFALSGRMPGNRDTNHYYGSRHLLKGGYSGSKSSTVKMPPLPKRHHEAEPDLGAIKTDPKGNAWGSKEQPYWRPGANPTVDNIITRDSHKGGREVLLIQRKKGAVEGEKWATPGGFHDTHSLKGEAWKHGKETAQQAAIRELHEETGLDAKDLEHRLKHVGDFEGGKRDPRDNEHAWSKSSAFHVHLTPEQAKKYDEVKGQDDAQAAKWVHESELKNHTLAFDHKKILHKAGLTSNTVRDYPYSNPLTNAKKPITKSQKIKEFEKWLKTQVDHTLTGMSDEELWAKYAQQGFEKGAAKAFEYVTAKDANAAMATPESKSFYEGTKGQFLKSAFGQPESVDKLKNLASKSFDHLKDITKEMSDVISQILTDGLSKGQNPVEIGKAIADTIDISEKRAILIARTEIIKSHAHGTLISLKKLGVDKVGVQVEFMVTGGKDGASFGVCEKCMTLQGKVFKIDDAWDLVPQHPNCKCALVAVMTNKPTRNTAETWRDRLLQLVMMASATERVKKRETTIRFEADRATINKRLAARGLITNKQLITHGGPGSGNYGHHGRPGEVGGSSRLEIPKQPSFVSSQKGNVEQNQKAISQMVDLAKKGDLVGLAAHQGTPSPKVQAYKQTLLSVVKQHLSKSKETVAPKISPKMPQETPKPEKALPNNQPPQNAPQTLQGVLKGVQEAIGLSTAKLKEALTGAADPSHGDNAAVRSKVMDHLLKTGASIKDAATQLLDNSHERQSLIAKLTDGNVEAAQKEFKDTPVYDLQVLSGMTVKTIEIIGEAVCNMGSRSLTMGSTTRSGSFRHELGHAIHSAMAGKSWTGTTEATKVIEEEYKKVMEKVQKNPKGLKVKLSHEEYELEYGVVGRRSLDNDRENMAEHYRLYHRELYRDKYEGGNGKFLAQYRQRHPGMAKLFDAHYTVALLAQHLKGV